MRLDEWITAANLDAGQLRITHGNPLADPKVPVEIEEFLQPAVADAIHGALQRVDFWKKFIVASPSPLDVVRAEDLYEIPEHAVSTVSRDRLLSHHDVARPLSLLERDKGYLPLLRYIGFLVSAELRDWILALSGANVKLKTVEISRYTRGDFLNFHSDAYNSKVLSLIAYFDPVWKEADGGEFIFESRDGHCTIAPRLGTLAIVPLGSDFRHAVTEFRREVGRWCIAAHYSDSGDCD